MKGGFVEMQSKDSVKMGGVFKTVMIIGILLTAIFSGVNMTNNDTVDLSGLATTADLQVLQSQIQSTAAGEVDLSSIEAKLDALSKPSLDQERLGDVYDKVYATEIAELEDAAIAAFDDEFDEDDFEDALEELIFGFDVLRSMSEDEDEFNVEVINLGLSDDEDKLVKVTRVYDIKYELNDDTDRLKDTVTVVGTITYDKDDGFEADLEYSL